jgi:hypothetical protein
MGLGEGCLKGNLQITLLKMYFKYNRPFNASISILQ